MTRYKLGYNEHDARPYFVLKLVNCSFGRFWQQVSPNYLREGNARRFARKHNMKLTKCENER